MNIPTSGRASDEAANAGIWLANVTAGTAHAAPAANVRRLTIGFVAVGRAFTIVSSASLDTLRIFFGSFT